MLSDQRSLFQLPDDLHYLNCASRSPLPTATQLAGQNALSRQLVPVSRPPEEYFEESERLRNNVATLVGCVPDRVAITPAVSYGINIAARNWPIGSTQSVVVPEEEFPSDVYAWIAACDRAEAELRTVSRPESGPGVAERWTEAMIEAIDDGTAVVSLSVVHWTDGTAMHLPRIVRKARDVGALVVLDGTQSLGAAPFAYEELQPDLLLCSTYKWLFGPEQIGFAVVGDRLIDAEPFEHHWSNRADSEHTSGTGLRHEFRHGARRFDVGGHNNNITLSMLNTSVEQVLAWGPEQVAAYCDNLLQPLDQYLSTSAYEGSDRADRAAHIYGIRGDSDLLDRAMAEMVDRNIRISRRGGSLRVSPHLYNTADDIDALVTALTVAAK